MGWNRLSFPAGRAKSGLFKLFKYTPEGTYVYFVHSYAAVNCGEAVIATTEYGAELTAAIAGGSVYGVQFHPEKSGAAGSTYCGHSASFKTDYYCAAERNAYLYYMITKRIIPCLDVRDGMVVKGVNFARLRDIASPVELACHYNDSGADELVFYDVAASVAGRKIFTDILSETASRVFIPLTVGGGINTPDDFERVLKCGADKVSVNTGRLRTQTLYPRPPGYSAASALCFRWT
jgi:hypothetical protein